MNKYFVVTLYTVMILTSFFQSETEESQHAKSLETNKYVMNMKVDPGGG
ncbi:hypothetical protein [Bacillus sp. AFS023182]|nr:hypothetical protein [Bacillus sp. AFS023182]